MKTWHALAVLLVLGVLPAHAEDTDKVATLRGEIELLELEHDVDKDILREAMAKAVRAGTLLGGKRPFSDEEAQQFQAEKAVLDELIRAKKGELVKRTVELERKKAELSAARKPTNALAEFMKSTQRRPNQPPKPSDDKDRQGLIGEMEEAQVEVLLLQRQYEIYQETLKNSIEALATAELVASETGTQRDKAEAERKQFDRVKKRYAEFGKRLQLEREKVAELRSRLGLGGMGGGMGGMGGGFR